MNDKFNPKSNVRNPGVGEEASATIIERSVDVRVGRRRLNWCNELIDWRCLRDRHRYTLETRLHVRWLSAQRRFASLSIASRVRHPALHQSCSPTGKATSAPNCQRAKYIPLFMPPLSFHAPLPFFLHYFASSHRAPLNSQPELIVG